jgi:hypothetical protein
MLTGRCLCGAVAYEADAEVEGIVHCHCETCRRAHASAFSSIAAVPRESFRWTRGEDGLTDYESSPGKIRRFCRVCGSQVVAERMASGHVMLRLGCLDTPIQVERQWHVWRSDASSWYDPHASPVERPEGLIRR